jgi:hypothetical protein
VARGRGGMRPTAPQNNPMNVSAVGGNGQNANATQAARYVPGLPYGEGQQMMDTQQSAPMAAAPGIESSGMAMAPGSAAATREVIPLGAPSQRADEPITFGANAGPGPGMEALGLPNQTATSTIQILEQLLPYDETGEIAALYELALLRGI